MMTVSAFDELVSKLYLYLPPSSAVTVGFIRTQVNVNESAGQENVCFGVRQGTLDRSIIVTVRTQDGQATCKPVMIPKILFSDTLFPQLQMIIMVGQETSP